ncbi:hypothetical protein C1I98_23030 [Spongiactinospora gelatinilytica]|uniref:Putative restriction endonuclease domain-containing protein n=1 Tax=Spongiactinospora gelatinilytica TaxID=2666298 RepID=A0A2W2GIA4_9ACTN|nr:hypothetical protein C1I98_23030 [Spongiactinospora gelatinilytica]
MLMAPSRDHPPQVAPIDTLCQELNDLGYKAEIVRGSVVVSPMTTRLHSRVVLRLTKALFPLVLRHEWELHQTVGVRIPPERGDMRLPDLLVMPSDDEFGEAQVDGATCLLAAEVCSPGTRDVDYRDKPLEYARAGIPLYLILDPLTEPPSLTLMSEPGNGYYEKVTAVEAGKPLALPSPFEITIDTGVLFGSAGEKGNALDEGGEGGGVEEVHRADGLVRPDVVEGGADLGEGRA